MSHDSSPGSRDLLGERGIEAGRLGIYLNDHLAAAVVAKEIATRCRAQNPSSAIARYLEVFLVELDEERTAVIDILRSAGGAPSAPKQAFAWATEKASRLKLNGQLTGYGDLSRLEELEFLTVGVRGKIAMWRSLIVVAESAAVFDRGVLARMLEQAQVQEGRLEQLRMAAALTALAQDADEPSV